MKRDDLIKYALQNPEAAEELIMVSNAEESLAEYIKLMWHVLEPKNKLKMGWGVEAICEHLEAITRGEIKRLLINVPPGMMKSLSTQVFWPSWYWGPKSDPGTSFICAAYSEGLTLRDNRKALRLMKSELYQRLWGHKFSFAKENESFFENSAGGFKLATSTGGTATGMRGDIGILDDPISVGDAESEIEREKVLNWFVETWTSRVNDPEDSPQLVIMQRVHERDVAGYILEELPGLYDALILPMEFEPERRCFIKKTGFVDPRKEEGELLFPERFPRNVVERDKATYRSRSEYAVACQFQQRPIPREGGMFKVADVKYLDHLPEDITIWVRGWDLAGSEKSSAARTAGLLLGLRRTGELVIADVEAGRWSPNVVLKRILGCANRDPRGTLQSLPQDPGQAGLAQKKHIADMLEGHSFKITTESGDKYVRALPMASQFEAGNVFIVKGQWNKDFVSELTNFPGGRYKDQVDALSRAYMHLMDLKKRRRSRPVPPTEIEQEL